MIISRTPFRVSLFGGGTDLPAWYRKHGGSVIGGAIDKYCTISLRTLPPFFQHRSRIVYSSIELVQSAEEIRHPSVRAVLMEMGVRNGVEIHHDGDLPARSGLGSSSSFTVGLLNAVYAYQGRMVSKAELAAEAIRIEQEVIGEQVGCQDQVWAAYGGLNRIDFHTDGSFEVTPLVLTRDRREELQGHFLLCFTGLSRFASEIEKEKVANFSAREANLREMRAMVDAAADILRSPNRSLEELGRMLHESWLLKRGLSPNVSNTNIDAIYDAARAAGALGGKLLGAGGGGFLLLCIPPERQAAVRKRLEHLITLPFRFDSNGSKIVVYDPDDFERRPLPTDDANTVHCPPAFADSEALL
ncbi:kinase (plasmid) [Azospirillum argentinense]|uniref:Kinase n=1 Tax=Azospirillum argentinense TaxID=2970906 RepID=A0A060DV67_9PROT|nr:kinase [Azospirillum argentinense]AIB16662.1 kinase [Azospirillum argentinense]EZQ02279.1 kinase [Azospirillum argentinense]MBK3802343.1 kinase [Azospirillum argentinense]